MRDRARVRAVVAVLVLGATTGAGAVLGLWAGLAWWLARHPAGAEHDPSLLGGLGAAAVGVVLGLVAGVAVGLAVLLVAVTLRSATTRHHPSP